MENRLHMRVVSPTGVIFDGAVEHATFPGAEGSFAVFPRHAPIISALGPGVIVYFTEGGTERKLAIAGGFLEVDKDNIIVAAETERSKPDTGQNKGQQEHGKGEPGK